MKPIKSLIVLLLLVVPGAAFAQGYYGPGGGAPSSSLPGGFHNRMGRLMFGGSFGLGGMHDDFGDIDCANCNSVSGLLEGHLGGFIGPRLALLGQLEGNFQTLEVRADSETTLVQGSLMFAAQYWLTPQLWIKGGLGFASLQVQDSDAFGVFAESRPENGTALMGAVGIELLSAQYFSVDLHGSLTNGSYKGLDNNVTALNVNLGVNWY